MVVEIKLACQVESTDRQGRVVSSFRFQRDDVAKRRRKFFGPCSTGDHHFVGVDLVAVLQRDDRTFAHCVDALSFAFAKDGSA